MRASNDVETLNDPKNNQISQLTDMVKTLLEEQRMLKQKLEIQELKMRESGGNADSGSGLLQRNKKEITKRVSERIRS